MGRSFNITRFKSVCFDPLGSFRWHRSTFSTTCLLVKVKRYYKTCWAQMGVKNVKKRNSTQQSPLRPRAAVQKHRRLLTGVQFSETKL